MVEFLNFTDFFSGLFSNNEVFTKKTQTSSQVTINSQTTNTSNFSDQRSVQLILNSPNASQSTKKEFGSTVSPGLSSNPSLNPLLSSPQTVASGSNGSLSGIGDVLLIGGLVGGGLIVLSSFFGKKK